jgi:hypothetical protein
MSAASVGDERSGNGAGPYSPVSRSSLQFGDAARRLPAGDAARRILTPWGVSRARLTAVPDSAERRFHQAEADKEGDRSPGVDGVLL